MRSGDAGVLRRGRSRRGNLKMKTLRVILWCNAASFSVPRRFVSQLLNERFLNFCGSDCVSSKSLNFDESVFGVRVPDGEIDSHANCSPRIGVRRRHRRFLLFSDLVCGCAPVEVSGAQSPISSALPVTSNDKGCQVLGDDASQVSRCRHWRAN